VPKQKSRPAGDRAASEIVLADAITNNENRPFVQGLDDLARYQAMVLVSRFSVSPELAVALAAVAFNGGAG
jgi:hypothetical protein